MARGGGGLGGEVGGEGEEVEGGSCWTRAVEQQDAQGRVVRAALAAHREVRARLT